MARAIENLRGQDRHDDCEGGSADDAPGDGNSHMVNIAVEVEYPAIEGTPRNTNTGQIVGERIGRDPIELWRTISLSGVIREVHQDLTAAIDVPFMFPCRSRP